MRNNKKGRSNDSRSHQNSGDNSGRFTSEHPYRNTSGINENDYRNRDSYNSDHSRVGEWRNGSYNNDVEQNNREFNDRSENWSRSNGNYADNNRMNRDGSANRRDDFQSSLQRDGYDTNNLSSYDNDDSSSWGNRDDYSNGTSNSRYQSDSDTNGNGQSQSGRKTNGQFRGRGPKGYQRSDDRIKEEINDRLTDDGELDASEIEVTVEKGEVTLSGSVSERNDKRRAEDIAESISGVNNVENRIRVTRGSADQQSEKSETRKTKHTAEMR